MKQGKLSLREVGTQRWSTQFSEKDSWVVEALKTAAPHEELSGKSPEQWALNSTCSGELSVERIDPEYSVFGCFQARVPLLCPRCGDEGSVAREGTFRLFVYPLGPREEADEAANDPDYIYLETPFLDLSLVLSEQVVAAESMVEFPDLDLQGKEHHCELSTGQNEPKGRESPFAALEALKSQLEASPKKK